MVERARPRSIRQRLLLLLIPSLLLIVACAAGLTYHVALGVATSAYDRSLLDPALDIAGNILVGPDGPHLALLQQAQEALLFDHEDTLVFQVRSPEGRVVAGIDDLVPYAELRNGERRFFDGSYRGQAMRIAAVRNDRGFYVQVGETLNKRERLIWQILGAGVLPAGLIALTSVLVAWTVIQNGLGPLAKLRTDLLRRTPGDLRPLDEDGAPIEIGPVVKAFNTLLGQLGAASERQQRFLADAAHQLRTPLSGLQMHLELLLQRPLSVDIRDQVTGMHAATVRASRLANQLLALAKAESSDAASIQLRPVDLYAIADQAAQRWVPRAIARDIDLGFVLEHARVAGDAFLLSELLDNLVDNAIRYTPQGGTVTVRSGHDVTAALLSVEDNGPGITATARKKVFERFYRVAGTPGDGSGLGLAIVKEIVERHGGSIDVDDTYLVGTKIVVRLTPYEPSGTSSPSDD